MDYELLAPAGSPEALDAAIYFGADAVYVGGPAMQLRAGSAGFSMETLAQAVRTAHASGRRLYVAVNAFAYNDDIDALGGYARSLAGMKVDAVIVSDLGAVVTIRRAAPELDIHISTQANCLNYAAARAWADLGAKRVVLGREMTLAQIRQLRDRLDPSVELEVFVHGAMCMAYSGRCMLSAALAGRSANRGACTQSCRWTYHLMEQTRPGQFFPVEEDDRGMTILSSRDLNCMGFMDQLMDAGIASFKLEGRMKSPYYVATVTNAYRRRIDAIRANNTDPGLLLQLERELNAVSHRPYSSGFYFGEMKRQASAGPAYDQDCLFVGVVTQRLDNGRIRFELRNRIREGDAIELLSPLSLGGEFAARHMTQTDGAPVQTADRPSECYEMDCPLAAQPGDMLRVRQTDGK